MTQEKIRIDIVSDVVCPWCAIGYWRLKKAIATCAVEHLVNVVWHPFELNPNMAESGENLRAHLAQKYGTTLEGSIRARAMLTAEGKKVGFTFNYFDEMKMLNTHPCHQLLHWAKEAGLQTQLAEALFAHFFSDRGEFSHDELVAVATQVGLDASEASDILTHNQYSDTVKQYEQEWRTKGVQGVPLFIFNGENVLPGAQEVATFEQVLKQHCNE